MKEIEFPKVEDECSLLLPSRVIPNPDFVSDEARTSLHSSYSYYDKLIRSRSKDISESSARTQAMLSGAAIFGKRLKYLNDYVNKQYKSTIKRVSFAGMKADCVLPDEGVPAENSDKVLIHYCGGVRFFEVDISHIAIIMASLMKVKVYVPRYRHMPKYSFEELKEDVLATYKECLKETDGRNIGVFGESSGASISAALIHFALEENLPLPGALGLIGMGYIAGDSQYMNRFLDPMMLQIDIAGLRNNDVAASDTKNIGIPQSDILDEARVLGSFPPTLLITGSRDCSASGTINFHRKLHSYNVDVDLNIYEGMPHAHHSNFFLPEGMEAIEELIQHFSEKLA